MVAAGAVGLLTSCGGSSSSKTSATVPPNAGAVVDIKNIAFNPKTVTIKAGQTVAWKFDDGSITHDVVGEGFRSADQSSGVFVHTFAKAGVDTNQFPLGYVKAALDTCKGKFKMFSELPGYDDGNRKLTRVRHDLNRFRRAVQISGKGIRVHFRCRGSEKARTA